MKARCFDIKAKNNELKKFDRHANFCRSLLLTRWLQKVSMMIEPLGIIFANIVTSNSRTF